MNKEYICYHCNKVVGKENLADDDICYSCIAAIEWEREHPSDCDQCVAIHGWCVAEEEGGCREDYRKHDYICEICGEDTSHREQYAIHCSDECKFCEDWYRELVQKTFVRNLPSFVNDDEIPF